jgi:hypothetical protein
MTWKESRSRTELGWSIFRTPMPRGLKKGPDAGRGPAAVFSIMRRGRQDASPFRSEADGEHASRSWREKARKESNGFGFCDPRDREHVRVTRSPAPRGFDADDGHKIRSGPPTE